MTNIPMPEPVAEVCSGHTLHWAGSGPIAPLCERTGAKVGSLLITTTQAEAYADARVAESQQWQPIETAPKHVEVLVWRDDSGPFIAKFTDPYEVISVEEMERENMEFPDDFEEWYSDAYGWQEGSERPTHWMPLPAPPQQ